MNIISGEQALVELSKHKDVFYKDGSGFWCNDLLKENEKFKSSLQINQARLKYIENLNFFQRLLFLFFKGKILKRFGEIK